MHIHTENLETYFGSHQRNTSSHALHTKTICFSVLAVNEVTICNVVRKIPFYPCFFSLLEKYEKVETMPLTQQKYLFFYSDRPSTDLATFLRNSTDAKRVFSKMVDSLQHLLRAIHELEQSHICFFQVSPQSIVFLSEQPVLTGFRASLQLSKLSVGGYLVTILEETNLLRLPLEVHLLVQILVKKTVSVITETFIDTFCSQFVESLSFLKMCSPGHRKDYLTECNATMQKYVHWKQDEVINDLLGKSRTWDLYSLSLLFLEIFACMQRVFSLKGKVTSKLIAELMKNIHPDPEKRGNISNTLETVDSILEQEQAWREFAKKMDNHLLPMFLSAVSRYI